MTGGVGLDGCADSNWGVDVMGGRLMIGSAFEGLETGVGMLM